MTWFAAAGAESISQTWLAFAIAAVVAVIAFTIAMIALLLLWAVKEGTVRGGRG